jgi:hypothetical protein
MNASRSKIGVSSVEGDVEEAAHENRRVTVAHPLLYSISIVPGGLLVKSHSTLHTPSTSFTILVLTLSKNSQSKRKIFAVIKSVVCTASNL